ncbi:DUF302 domain-containing protein [Aquimarina sp. 2-A2]|uniref:DUF302 domain-containing protein n=1 Tax=Leeuwenhoekiella nanhaiensis TaxID=1655491 RepID=A0A2G1VMP8_9FLAO|nr:DUF302 domain-containing protein [Leeuwenhoekiella nanhaiensis]PHQ27759.1 hypothetical protein CJ305_18475 [Leeuwenhoekiella nanhaiensis]PHR87595.1 MAG: hypothetical protein COA80_18725 [Leeuwenhoekiella sp.]
MEKNSRDKNIDSQNYSDSQSTQYCIVRRYGTVTFNEVQNQIKENLRKAQFDVVAEMDICEYLEGYFKDLPQHLILLICNKKITAELISNDIQMTTLIPCKISIKEVEDNSIIEVSIEDIEKTWSFSEKPEIKKISAEIKKALTDLLDFIGPKNFKL